MTCVIIAALIVVIIAARILLNTAGYLKPLKKQGLVPSFSEDTEAIAAASQSVVMLECYHQADEPVCTGSGLIAFDCNTVITNYHVIENGINRMNVMTESGKNYSAVAVLTADKEHDLAILQTAQKIDAKQLATGCSQTLKKGEKVVAIGSPLGLINTVSSGIFSGNTTTDDIEALVYRINLQRKQRRCAFQR